MNPRDSTQRVERLGQVCYSNVAPLHWGLESGEGILVVPGVPTELTRMLLAGEIDLTLISSIEFLRNCDRLRALPDFSVSTLGPVYSVMLFHWRPWSELQGASVALTTESATGAELLKVLLEADGIYADLQPALPDLEQMLSDHDAALLIGDAALLEGVARREILGRRPLVTDLGAAWYTFTQLPFTFALWASKAAVPPSPLLVARLREAREAGLSHLVEVAAAEAERHGLSPSVMRRYLGNFRYYLEPPDRDGLTTFGRLALPGFDPERVSFWEL